MNFGGVAHDWRVTLGLTKSQVARDARMHLSSYWRVEVGEQEARASEIEAIAKAMGLTVAELLAGPPSGVRRLRASPDPKAQADRRRRRAAAALKS